MENKEEKKKLLKEIGLRMQIIRKRLGKLQKDFAKELGISGASLSEIESGNAKPMFDTLYNITKKYNVNVYYLLHGNGDMFISNEIDHGVQLNEYGRYSDWLKKFLVYFKKSEIVRYGVMSHFRKLILENERLIKLDIQKEDEEDELPPLSIPPQ